MDPSAGARAVGSMVRGAEELATSEPARVMLERAMQAGGSGPMYAVRPPGGYMLQQPAEVAGGLTKPATAALSGVDQMMNTAMRDLTRSTAPSSENVNAVSKFLMDQGRQYFAKSYASTKDPIYDALKEGRIKPLKTDGASFRNYMMNAVREGDPEATQDLANRYDSAMRAYSVSDDSTKANAMQTAL